ncbi:MAG: hypothetical protein WBC33_11605 [Conexibacter sp.]
MQTKPIGEPIGSPIPGIIPEPVRVHHATVHERLTATPAAGGGDRPASAPARRRPIRVMRAKLLSVIRGGKQVADAGSPPASRTKER